MFFKFDRYTKGSFGQHRISAAANAFGSDYRLNRYNTPTDNLAADSILEEWLPKSAQMLNRLFRNIHKFDSIAGPAVDLISLMPFSEVTLIGVEDPKILEVYEQSIAELHIETFLPEVACEYLVIGRVIGSLLFDRTKGIWTDIILQDPDFCDITNIPLRGYDPKIDLKLSDEFKKFLVSKDPRDLTAKQDLPEDFLKLLLSADKLPLDPASTLYLPRKTFPNDYLGSSIFYRILPFYALEKTLINGTLVGAKRRQRSILHVMVGEPDIWEPDEDEISTIAGMFMRADEDPQGAIVATRNGVATNEVRSGGDFWKLSDEWDFLSAAKMRALGINEAFLCLTGDTLITTENGLQRIDQMQNSSEKDTQDISTKVMSLDNKEGTAIKWIYRGVSDTQEITTENGRLLKSTKEHKVLVLEKGSLVWKEASLLKSGDNLCINSVPYTRKTKLELNLPIWTNKKHATCTKKLKTPQYMTPELAYLLGLIVSEGSHSCRISFSNSRIELLDKYAQLMLDLFGLQTKRELSSKKGDIHIIKGVKTISKVGSYCEEVESIVLNSWLEYLGLYTGGSVDGKFPSYYKVIPWCILRADEESQLAYLAAYLEGDGTLSEKGITFFSVSRTNLRMIQTLLNSHGILSRVLENYPMISLDKRSSSILYKKIQKYLVSKVLPNFTESSSRRNGTYGGRKFGLPTDRLCAFLRGRKQRTTGLGAWFLNDNGEAIFIKKWGIIDRSERWNYLLYETYQKGSYSEFLDALKQISKTEHENTIKLLELKYFYDKVKIVRAGEKQAVYDLSMCPLDAPAFVAEGIIIHNSGDATYNCCTGDSLIPTEKGLLRLDEITNGTNGEIKDIDITVGSKQGHGKAVKWLNNGIQDTLKITDECGHSLCCTPKHKFLVLKNNELVWVESKDLIVGDIVSINTKSLVRKEKLKLDLPYKESKGYRSRIEPKSPEYMTPELAFIIGCLVAEGSVKNSDTIFYNSNEAFIKRYSECVEEVFGLKTFKRINTKKGEKRIIKGVETTASKNCYQVGLPSQTLADWMKELGLYTEGNQEKNGSYYKVIPWSILQADEQSQLAFLAAYLEGDGSINQGRSIRYFSSSETLINQLQALLNIHGILSTQAHWKGCEAVVHLLIGNIDSFKLWDKIKQYMVSKQLTKVYTSSEIRKSKGIGIPTDSIRKFLQSRKVKSSQKGIVFRNDNGVNITFKNASRIFHLADLEKFSYDSHDLGKYDTFLEYLKQISETEYTRLIELFELRYRFTKIISNEDNGKQNVYDLSMSKDNEPVYVSGCFQTHNTMEVALSVFVETLRSFRDSLVSRIFYEKLFPILAEIHGFKRRSQAELAHRIRIEGTTVDSSLIIPQINFHKQLRPEADTAYLEVLGTMEEKGIPVPLRTWAAAGGLNLEKLMDMEDEDIENRKQVQEWRDKVEKETGGSAEEGGGEGGGAEAPPKEGGAWGSLINVHIEAVRKSLDSLPIWINNRFCDTSKDKFISIFKSRNPSKKLIALYKNKPKQLEAANYVLHRMGANELPFDVSATRNIADHLKRCASIYSSKRVGGEFTFLNKVIRESQNLKAFHPNNKKMQEALPASMGNKLYSGVM